MSHGRKNLLGSFSYSYWLVAVVSATDVGDEHDSICHSIFVTNVRHQHRFSIQLEEKKKLKVIKSVSMNFLNSINIDDVSQGDVGDCWLLSSIIAVVNFGQDLINDIICLEENLKNPNGPFKFKFHKCGKWHSGKG